MNQHFVIWSAGWNCEKYVKQHMESVNNQTYVNYTAIVVDDASTDNTWKEINKYKTEKYKLFKNEINRKNAHNIVNILSSNINDSDVVVNLDLDDWFAHDHVLNKLNDIYSKGYWATYGHYKHLSPKTKVPKRGYPSQIIKQRNFRQSYLYWHHPRTFKGFLLHNIDPEDIKDPDGSFIPNTWDLAVGFPILEMTPSNKLKYISEVLMVYNALNPLRISSKARGKRREYFRNKPQYKMLDESVYK